MEVVSVPAVMKVENYSKIYCSDTMNSSFSEFELNLTLINYEIISLNYKTSLFSSIFLVI